MERQIAKSIRLPRSIVREIEKIVKADGSTISQFMRTATIEKLNRLDRG